MLWLQYSKFSTVSSLFCSHENTHKLFFPKFSFESLAPSHSNYFLHLSPPKFFPLTLTLSQNFPKIFSLSVFHLGISWALSFSFSLSLKVISLSPLIPLLSFSPPLDPSATATHCTATHLPQPPSATDASTAAVVVDLQSRH